MNFPKVAANTNKKVQLNLSLPWGQKKVAIVERLKQELMHGLSAPKNGHCREVAVVGGDKIS